MNTYPHMCRDEHEEIGHRDGEHEMCPLCRANARIAELEEAAREAFEHMKDGYYGLAGVTLSAALNPPLSTDL